MNTADLHGTILPHARHDDRHGTAAVLPGDRSEQHIHRRPMTVDDRVLIEAYNPGQPFLFT